MTSATQKNISRLPRLLGAFLLSLSVLLGFQGCSSGGGSSAPVVPVDSDPVGYFIGSAILDTTTINSPDMVGLAYDSRIMIFNMAENVLLDITLTDITLTDFTGSVDVYIGGNIQGAGGTTVTGTTNNSQIEGTFTFAADAGFTTGSFDILFDINNNIGATLARADNTSTALFVGQLSGIDIGVGVADTGSTGNYSIADIADEKCDSKGILIVPDSGINIYQLDHDVIAQTAIPGTCSAPYLSTGHTGFVSVIAKSVDKDTFVFAYANGSVALFSDDLTR